MTRRCYASRVDRDAILATIEAYLAPRGDVAAAWVFGSIARGTARASSDVDVAVLFREPPTATLDAPPLAVEGDLERILARPVQIVSLHDAPADLVHRVLRDGVLVADRDRSARIGFEVRARNEYFDLEPVRRLYRAARNAP